MTYSHGENIIEPCYYNDGVCCDKRNLCSFCGWAPGVHKKRVQELKDQEKRGETPHVQVQKRHPGTL